MSKTTWAGIDYRYQDMFESLRNRTGYNLSPDALALAKAVQTLLNMDGKSALAVVREGQQALLDKAKKSV